MLDLPIPEKTLSAVENKIKALQKQIQSLQNQENDETATRLGISIPDLQNRTNTTRSIETTYQRLQTALKKQKA